MFDGDKTVETDDITVSVVASDDEDERCVTQLPGSDYKMEFDEDEDWVEHEVHLPIHGPTVFARFALLCREKARWTHVLI
jgi:hypothetical protein